MACANVPFGSPLPISVPTGPLTRWAHLHMCPLDHDIYVPTGPYTKRIMPTYCTMPTSVSCLRTTSAVPQLGSAALEAVLSWMLCRCGGSARCRATRTLACCRATRTHPEAVPPSQQACALQELALQGGRHTMGRGQPQEPGAMGVAAMQEVQGKGLRRVAVGTGWVGTGWAGGELPSRCGMGITSGWHAQRIPLRALTRVQSTGGAGQGRGGQDAGGHVCVPQVRARHGTWSGEACEEVLEWCEVSTSGVGMHGHRGMGICVCGVIGAVQES